MNGIEKVIDKLVEQGDEDLGMDMDVRPPSKTFTPRDLRSAETRVRDYILRIPVGELRAIVNEVGLDLPPWYADEASPGTLVDYILSQFMVEDLWYFTNEVGVHANNGIIIAGILRRFLRTAGDN